MKKCIDSIVDNVYIFYLKFNFFLKKPNTAFYIYNFKKEYFNKYLELNTLLFIDPFLNTDVWSNIDYQQACALKREEFRHAHGYGGNRRFAFQDTDEPVGEGKAPASTAGHLHSDR